jgi:hypothetical protein
MSAYDAAAGYPVHAVASFRRWTNQHGARFTNWTATCGATGQVSGHQLKDAHSARTAELCPKCWPAGHRTYHPEPTQIREAHDGR